MTDLPAALARELAHRLGSPLRAFAPAAGGYSRGTRGIVTLADGARVFVKATDAEPTDDYRAEAVVSAALPAEVPAPRLLFSCEVDSWVLLCTDVAPGTPPPEPWREQDLAAALDVLTTCARALTPAPIPGLPTIAERMAGRCEIWNELHGPASRLARVEGRWTELVTGDTLLHFDPRHDNFMIDPATGTAMLVDWGRACTGPDWADLVCLLLLSDLGGRDPEEIFTRHPLGAGAPAEAVDAMLVMLAGYWTRSARLDSPVRARRERSRRAVLD
ncbi:phosphotransferase [Nonomuraea sediminis]|uniref:phosphotransferase n=1 Tax=Nonomuraea sediminis TaxID=2835864 RepID=UPI001BDC5A81|nr:phosphotransferase [Nonomuraea sediminis]